MTAKCERTASGLPHEGCKHVPMGLSGDCATCDKEIYMTKETRDEIESDGDTPSGFTDGTWREFKDLQRRAERAERSCVTYKGENTKLRAKIASVNEARYEALGIVGRKQVEIGKITAERDEAVQSARFQLDLAVSEHKEKVQALDDLAEADKEFKRSAHVIHVFLGLADLFIQSQRKKADA
ncbi:hypothetical protein LCGC14_3098040 [marine sediment metagenome]|uniref:Uncharacterized protein n=1 Tax=marine sediment metagenome TaxID=412755 RepID=A0A0F8W916_9ZZZZ